MRARNRASNRCEGIEPIASTCCEIVAELGAFIFLAGDQPGADHRLGRQPLTQRADQGRIFGESLEQDRARAIERGLAVGDALFRVDEGGGRLFRRLDRDRPARLLRERFETGLARDLCLGPAPRLVRQVEIFEARLVVGCQDIRTQAVGELALLLDAGDHRGATILQFAQVAEALLEQAQLRIVESAGDFLAIAGDERHGGAAVDQLHGRLDLFRTSGDFPGDALFDAGHCFPGCNAASMAGPPRRPAVPCGGWEFRRRACAA